MSFKKYLEETNNATGFSKEQKLVLFIGRELEEANFKLNTHNDDNIFSNFKNKEGKFSFDFTKDNNDYNLIVENKKDGKYEISLNNGKRTSSEQIKIDNYLKENEPSLLKNYMKERIANIETNPLLYQEPKRTFNYNDNINNNNDNMSPLNLNINRCDMNDINPNFNNFNDNVFVPNPHYNDNDNDIGMNFRNIGYGDLHGDLPNFGSGFNNDFYGGSRGNLMGRDAFNMGGMGGIGGIGGIKYDPMTPFGPKFDFIPQYGSMRKPDNGFNNFGGGGYNPFI